MREINLMKAREIRTLTLTTEDLRRVAAVFESLYSEEELEDMTPYRTLVCMIYTDQRTFMEEEDDDFISEILNYTKFIISKCSRVQFQCYKRAENVLRLLAAFVNQDF